ncbi:MAG: hypothetical protein UV73_C0001G0250 [Candidatus Gottesmanbacteria bacterium GW2011_GWA2_43_14]|uniref:Uncharacterized protein n=1 Tax=Candidatus Gottesmanbacteria bacterium GW2011_GWA2_43_14 TaxID=1618443 RepID=A0A0G1DM73_9BACT|nr:MAG: hypothetical protein UV73_C0001G0250 [Candidatus Gottesmanbacteria bacterium GW2011_GWA2_43_14]
MKKIVYVVLIALGLVLSACVATDQDLEAAMNSQATQVGEQINEAIAAIPTQQMINPDEIAEQVIEALPKTEPTPEPMDPYMNVLDQIVDRLEQIGQGNDQLAKSEPSIDQPTGLCPTTEEAKNLTGVDVQRLGTESCAFVWRGVSGATVQATCPSDWVCTWDVVQDITVVHVGVDQTAQINAGTWRVPGGYPSDDAVHNVCELYQKEKAFGASEVPSFEVRFQAATDGAGVEVGPRACP